MKKQQWICLVLLASFVITILGCGSPENVVQNNEKTGLSKEERASKRGN